MGELPLGLCPLSFSPLLRPWEQTPVSEALGLATAGPLITSHGLAGFPHPHGMKHPHSSWGLTLNDFFGTSDSLNLDLQLAFGDLYQRILLLGLKQTALQVLLG